jgi:predicted site-specific integrase-resolvase
VVTALQNIDVSGVSSRHTDMTSECRLMDLYEAAAYCHVSYWTVRDWVQDGSLSRVCLPCGRVKAKNGAVIQRAGDKATRKILIDRRDLDRLIDESKELANA